MKALILEFFYEKKSILTITIISLILYFTYIFLFRNPELISANLSSYMLASLYGGVIYKRKISNFEEFLTTTPLGRKTIIKTGYVLGLILSIVVVIVFSIFYFIRKSFMHIDILLLNLDDILILTSFGTGLITNAIFFPLYMINDRLNTGIISLLSFLILGLVFAILYFLVLKLDFFSYSLKILIHSVGSIVIYIISYFITINKYLKKDI